MRSALPKVTSTCAPNIRWPSSACAYAIKQAERLGLLGNNICGSRLSFHLDVRLGAGAFVCGEETALIASVEGRRGIPRPRPPYPAMEGLFGKPTLINNVETFASIAPIIRNGGEWYAQIGTEKSKGTKVFALAGSINNTGLVEVPMGTTLREMVFDIGGGMAEGRQFKAVQTGGPSGGCLPEQFLDMPVDYENLARAGSIMGSGGMIVMDDTSCMVDVARFFMDFCVGESCGKCVPCRVGTYHMHGILHKITQRRGSTHDIAQLEELADLLKNTSLCGLGQSAPNPVLSTLRYFAEEYKAHVEEHRCPAGVCKDGSTVMDEFEAADAEAEAGVPADEPTPSRRARRKARNDSRLHHQDPEDRRARLQRRAGRDHPRRRPPERHLHSHALRPARPLQRGRLPPLPGRDQGTTNLLPACSTLVEEGMEVTTDSERLLRYRQVILELLFTERNHVCSVCVSNGHCELQTLAQKLGITHVHFRYRYPNLDVDASHERFSVDHNRCILCTRCVRVCEEIEGAHTWDVMGRGIQSLVITDLAEPWGSSETCTGCGKCVHVCPTGALFEKGKSVAEMLKRRQFLPYLTQMREENQ